MPLKISSSKPLYKLKWPIFTALSVASTPKLQDAVSSSRQCPGMQTKHMLDAKLSCKVYIFLATDCFNNYQYIEC